MKDKTTAIILSALLGGLGVDRFYLGYTGMGVLKLLTGGCFGILWILDIINIASGKLQPADGSGYSDDSNAAAQLLRFQCFRLKIFSLNFCKKSLRSAPLQKRCWKRSTLPEARAGHRIVSRIKSEKALML